MMNQPLTLGEILNNPGWLPIVQSFEQCSSVEKFDAYFERPWSIHGVKHARRVLFHTLILCELCKIEVRDKALLMSAALFHDIGRDSDGLCFKHGKRSVEKMVALDLAPIESETFSILKFIVTFHCIQDSQAEAELNNMDADLRDRTWRLFSVLKDADGLDRVRIGDLDVRYLRNPESVRLTGLAHELLIHI